MRFVGAASCVLCKLLQRWNRDVFSCELNMFAEHRGQDMLGWIGARCNRSSSLVLMELGQRLALQVKHDSLVTKYTGD